MTFLIKGVKIIMEKIIELKIKKDISINNKEDIFIEINLKNKNFSNFLIEKIYLENIEKSILEELFKNISKYFLSKDFLLFFKEEKLKKIKLEVKDFLKIDSEIETEDNWKENFVKNFKEIFEEEIKTVLETIDNHWEWLSEDLKEL